jgi:Cof subfamily protein (haloacid dehalogenase superfamily)
MRYRLIATARPPRATVSLYDDLGLSGPIIAYNGALIYDPVRKVPLLHHPLEKAVALQVLREIRALDPHINVGAELADEWHVDRIDDRLRGLYAAGRIERLPMEGPVEDAVAMTARGVSKLYFVAPSDVRAAAEQRFAAAGLDVAVTSSGSAGEGLSFVEVHAPGVSKGAALRALSAILGIPREATIALGDEENDLSALAAAGLGIAMGNAAERVKAAASAVTGPHTADGWAEAVERYALAG